MFNLPDTIKLNKIIPKNAFDTYSNSKQKKMFADCISRITWTHKLSTDTTNLPTKSLIEIQVFNIELKQKVQIKTILSIIDKAIPYPIIFIINYQDSIYLSTSPKHTNPINEDLAVIDYTYSTDWYNKDENNFKIELKSSLDWVYKTFCEQFNSLRIESRDINELVSQQKQSDLLRKEIEKLKTAISKCKQFNKKVELNIRLKALEGKLCLCGYSAPKYATIPL